MVNIWIHESKCLKEKYEVWVSLTFQWCWGYIQTTIQDRGSILKYIHDCTTYQVQQHIKNWRFIQCTEASTEWLMTAYMIHTRGIPTISAWSSFDISVFRNSANEYYYHEMLSFITKSFFHTSIMPKKILLFLQCKAFQRWRLDTQLTHFTNIQSWD